MCNTSGDTTCTHTRCVIEGIAGVCRKEQAPDGSYPLPSNPPSLPPILRLGPSTTCVAGNSLCEAPLRYLPRMPMAAPPLVLAASAICTVSSDCPAPAECFQAPTCVDGMCMAALPLLNGTACDDGDPNSVGDMCNGMGTCEGLG